MNHETNHLLVLNMHFPRHPVTGSLTNPVCSPGKEFLLETADTPQEATNTDKHRLRALLQHVIHTLEEADCAKRVHVQVRLHSRERDVVDAVGGVVVVPCVGNHGVDVRDVVFRFEGFDGCSN